ncbi:MAG: 2-phospho-L-lactate transferase [Acidiferrobacteraceae bacterium]|nr:2-phospho-L-lactate transferase [Acidiferrobacteraceae bacterium]
MTMPSLNLDFNYIILSGGVGGAKLAYGFLSCHEPSRLMVVGNVGDDFKYWGLNISPDLDTLLYTLAGVSDQKRGWGRSSETWSVLEEMRNLGGDSWFQLGDRDLAVHIERTERLSQGQRLSTITQDLAKKFGIECALLPITDRIVRTVLDTDVGSLEFQEYFVRHKCAPQVTKLHYTGCNRAVIQPEIYACLRSSALRAIIISPSNPFLSIDPMLSVSSFKQEIARCRKPVVAVSPLVGARAFKGPTAKIMRELGYEVSAFAVASHYTSNLIDGFVLDTEDSELVPQIQQLGIQTYVTDISMNTSEDKTRLAGEVLDFARTLEC